MRHPGRAIASAALTIAVAVSAGLLAPASTSAVAATHTDSIRLLPAPSAGGRVWNWSAACPLGPRTGSHCQGAGPVLGRAQLNGDEWNLGVTKPAEGVVRMTMSPSGGLTVRGQLPVAPPCTAATCLAPSANTWVRAYTNVSYGKNPCRAATSPAGDPALRLPVKVSALPTDLVGTTSYVSQASQTTYDIAYDMWLNPSGTQQPCRSQGTVEVMVWTDYDRQALLPSSPIGTSSIPYAVGGVAHDGTNAWSTYVLNVHRAGRTSPYGATVFLVLNAGDVVPAGTVSVDVTKALSAVGTLLEQDYGWSDFASHYWLDTIPFGMEVGPVDAQPWGTGSTNFTLGLSSYCFGLNATVAHPKC
jgi:Glycosyl hydrolase family 12